MRILARVAIENNRIPEIMGNIPIAMSEALDAAADAVVDAAKDRAPVRTGALRASIVKVSGLGSVMVTATAFYAGFVEFGTRFMAAQPFLRPAYEALNKRAIIDQFYKRLGL